MSTEPLNKGVVFDAVQTFKDIQRLRSILKKSTLIVERRLAHKGSISALGVRQASFFDHSPPVPVFAPTNL